MSALNTQSSSLRIFCVQKKGDRMLFYHFIKYFEKETIIHICSASKEGADTKTYFSGLVGEVNQNGLYAWKQIK
jgi:hypothetical protein